MNNTPHRRRPPGPASALRVLAGVALTLSLGSLGSSCADLASDCQRLGTCGPGEGGSGAGNSGGGGGGGLALGAPCDAPSACASGFCADGVCCDTACEGSCTACALPEAAGTCAPRTGESCGEAGTAATCDGAGFCAVGTVRFVRIAGTSSADSAADGAALLPGGRVVLGGAVSDASVSFAGLSGEPAVDGPGLSGVLGPTGDGEDLTLWPVTNGRLTHFAAAGDDVIYGGLFSGSLSLPGVPNYTNLGPADAFLYRRPLGEDPRWGFRFVSSNTEPARIEAIAANDTRLAVAVVTVEASVPRRVIQVLSLDGTDAGRVFLDLGSDPDQGGVTAMDLRPDGTLWVLAEYRGNAVVDQGQGPDVPLASSGFAGSILLTRTVLLGYDVATLDLRSGPYPLGTASDVFAGGLAADDATVYVSGGFGSSLDNGEIVVAAADTGAGDIVLTSDMVGSDPFVLALDAATGRARWGQSWTADSDARVTALATDGAGDVVLAGDLQGQVLFGNQALAGAGGPAAYVAKLGPSAGDVFWALGLSSSDWEAEVRWVGIDRSDGQVWVFGRSAGPLLGGAELGDLDVFAAALSP